MILEAFCNGDDLEACLFLLFFILIRCSEVNFLHGSGIDTDFAEMQEVSDLVSSTNEGVFQSDFFSAFDIIKEEGSVGVATIAVEDADFFFLQL
jgi:hypothetical protein